MERKRGGRQKGKIRSTKGKQKGEEKGKTLKDEKGKIRRRKKRMKGKGKLLQFGSCKFFMEELFTAVVGPTWARS